MPADDSVEGPHDEGGEGEEVGGGGVAEGEGADCIVRTSGKTWRFVGLHVYHELFTYQHWRCLNIRNVAYYPSSKLMLDVNISYKN